MKKTIDNINIVIPMAGAGSRFQISGFDVPKPFIEFKNKMMIEHVLSSFEDFNANFILVLQEKFLEEQKTQVEKLKKYNVKITTVPRLTMGASVTALAAHKAINKDYDILFADSDNIFNPKDISNFILDTRKRDLEGALLTFKSNEPCYSYAKINDKGYLIETKEKEVISDFAIAGCYYFKNLENFKNSTIDLIVANDKSKGEFYMSNVYNYLMKSTDKIGIYTIDKFDCVGTPAQLDEYIKKGNYARV